MRYDRLQKILGKELMEAPVHHEPPLEQQRYLDSISNLFLAAGTSHLNLHLSAKGAVLLYKAAHFSGRKKNLVYVRKSLLDKVKAAHIDELLAELMPWLAPMDVWETIWFIRLIRKRLSVVIPSRLCYRYPQSYAHSLKCECPPCTHIAKFLLSDAKQTNIRLINYKEFMAGCLPKLKKSLISRVVNYDTRQTKKRGTLVMYKPVAFRYVYSKTDDFIIKLSKQAEQLAEQGLALAKTSPQGAEIIQRLMEQYELQFYKVAESTEDMEVDSVA